ncbi:MAG: YegS/Rv2252/BmrU family lipid kinase [Crocinitomix sp.]|nr:YegS/Rv2252/BmrU family lipid kinase [Crocinitomix sp.]
MCPLLSTAQENYQKEVIALVAESDELQGKTYHTKSPKHAIEIAKEVASKSDLIIAVGGDGTCNEVINGIELAKASKTKFAVIPNGTGNDFSVSLSIKTPQEFISKIRNKSFKPIDIGIVEVNSKKISFVNVADIGFGAKVVEVLNRQRTKGLGGKVSYALAILRTFFLHKKAHIEIKGNDFEFKGKFLMVAFCNGSTFGHGLVINPHAKINSNQLNLTIIGDVSIVTYLLNLNRLKKGIPINHPKIHYYETENTSIKIVGEKQWVEGDGELLGSDVKAVYIKPNAIELLI